VKQYINLPKTYSNLGSREAELRGVYQELGFVIVGESVYENAYVADVSQGGGFGGAGGWTVGHLPNDPKDRLFKDGVFRATVLGDMIRFECRYEVRLLLRAPDGALCSSAQIADRYGAGSDEARACPMTWCAYDRQTGEPARHGAFFAAADSDPEVRTRALDAEKAKIIAWLDAEKPGWQEPLRYWK